MPDRRWRSCLLYEWLRGILATRYPNHRQRRRDGLSPLESQAGHTLRAFADTSMMAFSISPSRIRTS